jgi:hypothetical protein
MMGVLAAMLASSTGPLLAAPPHVIIRVGPPEPRVVVTPAPRPGYLWAPGYWNWQNQRHVWVGGHWLRDRKGYAYNQPRWRENNGGWELERGRWSRNDRDGDGVPNNRDRAPDNPRRQ